MKKVLTVCLLMAILATSGMASNDKILIASIASFDDANILSDYPGRYWGKSGDRIFLSGGVEEENWLIGRSVKFESLNHDSESSYLFLIYADKDGDYSDDLDIIYRGDCYLLTSRAPQGNLQYRRLSLKRYPATNHGGSGSVILDYDPVINNIISQVSRDTIITFLAGLSGETGVWVNGQLDTIATRFSGTEGNELAAAYLLEMFTNYGYQSQYQGFFGASGRNITMYDENLAWMVTENARGYRTTNGGAAWISMAVNTNAELWGITSVGPDSVWVVGNNGTVKLSTDGGQSFISQNYGGSQYLFGVNFIDNVEGWIAGDNGLILHTTNSGTNWASQSTPTSSRLYDVCFIDDEYGWAVGRNGVVIHTTNGGVSWTSQSSNSSSRLYSVDFTDRNNGWLCGWDGVVRSTTDGGTNWQTVYLGTNTEKYHVEFANSNFGWIAGWDGEIFATSDGGDNWLEQTSNTTSDFYGLSFADTLNGVAAGSGVISRTTDGGVTWINQSGNVEDAWRNVIATKTGTLYPDEQVIICAHFDNTSEQPGTNAPGADDNGSGATAVIEAARLFASGSFEKTIKFCLWTGEEQGLVGSEVYAAEASANGDDIVGVYNFDMIGYDGNGDGVIELHCGTTNPSILLGDLFETVITDYGLSLAPVQITFGSTDRSDHASFWDFNYPAILGIEDFSSDFNPYYHTTWDIIANFDTSYFTDYVKAAIGATATLATPDSTMSSIEESETLPSGFVLKGNYPNPFNAATTISFTLASQGDVDLTVYDVLGRKVAQLHEGRLNSGDHRITWNADEMSSGLYFYRLSVNGFVNSGRMTLLK